MSWYPRIPENPPPVLKPFAPYKIEIAAHGWGNYSLRRGRQYIENLTWEELLGQVAVMTLADRPESRQGPNFFRMEEEAGNDVNIKYPPVLYK